MRKTLTALASCLYASLLCAQLPSFRHFSLNEGLPQSQVNAFAADQYGYLWIATRGGGAARFDGKTFDVFSRTHGLPSDFILSLKPFGSSMVIGTNRGLCFYTGNRFTISSKATQPVTAICNGPDENLVIATGNKIGLLRPDHSLVMLPFIFKYDEVIADLEYRNDTLFACTDNGLYVFSTKQPYVAAPVKHIGSTQMRNTYVRQLAQWKGGILLGTYGDGIYYYKKGNLARFSGVSREDASIITHLNAIDENELWIGTQDKGCFILRNNKLILFNKNAGLSSNNILCVYKDGLENTWIGTSGRGFSLYRNQPVLRIGTENDPGAVVYAVYAYEKNHILVSSETRGFYYYEKGNLKKFNGPEELNMTRVRCFLKDHHNNLWLGTDGDGLFVQPEGTEQWHRYTARSGLNGNWISCLVSDTSGCIWAGFSGGGIARITYNGDIDVIKIRKRDGLAGDRITGMCMDSTQTLWYACDKGGIGSIKDLTLRTYALPDVNIRHLIFNGTHLLAASPEGIIRFDTNGKIIKKYTALKNEISSDNIYVLVAKGRDTLFAGQHNGVDMIIFNEDKPSLVKHIARESGFNGMEAVVRSGMCDAQGNVWIGTVNGLYRIFPSKLMQQPTAPQIHVRNISLLNVPIENTTYAGCFLNGKQMTSPVFSYNENQVSFDAVAVYPHNPGALTYSWRLLGLEKKWSIWQTQARSSYTNLPAGSYQLQVKIRNSEDLTTCKATLFSFVIDAPYWKKAWFITLVYGGAIIVLLLIFLLISSANRRRLKRKNERLQMEKNIISLRQKALRLQMNPHFIFHSLNGIQNLVINRQEENARQYISRFSKLMRDMVELASAETITLHNEIESLRNYLELEKLSRDHSFDYALTLHPDVEDDLVLIPPLVLQPLAENALVHGFRNMEKGGCITVNITQEKEVIFITIEDNGMGYEEGKKDPSSPGKKSTALSVTRERLELHYAGRYTFSIKNLNEEGKTGTRVTITLFPEH